MAGSPPVSDDPPPAEQAIVDANASFEPSPGAASFCGFKLPFFKFGFGLHLPPLPIPFPLPVFSFSLGLSCDPLGIDVSAGVKFGGGRVSTADPDPDEQLEKEALAAE